MTNLEALLGVSSYLQQLDAISRKMKALSRQYLPAGIRAVDPGRITGNMPDAAQDQQYAMLEAMQAQTLRKYEEAMEVFQQVLCAIRNPTLQTVIMDYYGMGMTDSRIAETLCLSTRRVNQMRNEFVRGLEGAA